MCQLSIESGNPAVGSLPPVCLQLIPVGAVGQLVSVTERELLLSCGPEFAASTRVEGTTLMSGVAASSPAVK
jgi:hypothetical protein